MSETEIRTQVREFIINSLLDDLDASELTDDASFDRHHLVDSMGALDIILFVEETYGITVENEDATPQNFDSIDNIVGFVQRKGKGAAG